MKAETKQLILRAILCILFLLAAVLVPHIPYLPFILALIAYSIIGFDLIQEAIKNLFHGEWMDESFLMLLATSGAFITGEYPEAVIVILLFQIGELLEEHAIDTSRQSIAALMDIRPDYANVERNGTLLSIAPQEVKIGDIIVVKPGEKIPLDGEIIEGSSMLDVSSLTGESTLQKVTVGSEVLSGTVNQSGMLQVRVSKIYQDCTVSKILELVEKSHEKKTKTERFITKFARIYTPFVVFSALLLAILPPLFIPNASWMEYLHRACTFLVISCPCALVISIPLGFFAGIGGASKAGILIKGSNYLEALANAKSIVWDKTGTLTKGSFEVVKIVSNTLAKEDFLRIAAFAENYSNHPIALSIKKTYGKTIDGNLVTNSNEIPGKGLLVTVEGKNVAIGNHSFLQSLSIPFTEVQEMGTVIYLAIEKEYAGYLVIADKIKEDARTAITSLQNKHLPSVMLTGDHENVARLVAQELNIEEIYANLLPTQKVEKMEQFLAQCKNKETVIFVGDGINDAPVLTRADVGIAMGGLGSDAAIEAADVVIMDDSLPKIASAIDIATKTLQIVKQNIVFAIGMKLLVLFFSAFGLATMWMAVFADVGVAFLAILNAMRGIHFKNKFQ